MVEQEWCKWLEPKYEEGKIHKKNTVPDTARIMEDSQELDELNGYEKAFYALLICVRARLFKTAGEKNVLPVDLLAREYHGNLDVKDYRKRILLRQYYALLFYRTIRLVDVPRAPKASVIGLAAWLARHIEVDHDVSLDS